MKSLAIKLPPGDLGTDCTVAAMKAIVEHAAANCPELDQAITRHVNGREDDQAALYEWLRTSRRFQRDPKGIEHVRHPQRFLVAMLAGRRPGMDCDDVATIGAAMLKRMGHAAAIVVLSRRPYPAAFQHVHYASFDADAPRPFRIAWPDNEAPAGFQPWDPQEWQRVPRGGMAECARFRVYPV